MPEEIIIALAAVKRACALVNRDFDLLYNEIASNIFHQTACIFASGLSKSPRTTWTGAFFPPLL